MRLKLGAMPSTHLHPHTPHTHPAELSIHQNAYTLARYAVICQENGLVSGGKKERTKRDALGRGSRKRVGEMAKRARPLPLPR